MFSRLFRYGRAFARFMATVMALCMVIAGLMLWPIPHTATVNRVDTLDILLRCVEYQSPRPYDAFRALRANAAIQSGIVAVPRPGADVKRITATRLGDGFQQESFGPVRSERFHTTTEHLVAPAREVAAARDGLEALYPPDERAAWRQLGEWGKGLFVMNWDRRNNPDDIPPGAVVPPADGTEEEHYWLVWQVMSAGNPKAAADFARLPELARSAYADSADYEAAIAWARTLYSRLKQAADRARADHRDSTNTPHINRLAKHETWMPPESETTYRWMLYTYVGLDADSRRAARERWLSFFAPHKAARVEAWGRELESDRRAAGEPLPPPGETVPLLCVVERYDGTDASGERAREAYRKQFNPDQRSLVASFVAYLYPSDDFYLIYASGDPFDYLEAHSREVFLTLWMMVLVIYGFRYLVFGFLAERVLRLRDDPRYQEYRRRRGRGSKLGWAVAYVIVPVIAWGITLLSTPREVDLLVRSPAHAFFGVYLSVLLGGTLLGFITRLLAVFLLKFGVDVNRVWADEVVGVALGVYILQHFGNEPLQIASFVAFELAPMVLHKARRRAEESGGPPPLPAEPEVLMLEEAEPALGRATAHAAAPPAPKDVIVLEAVEPEPPPRPAQATAPKDLLDALVLDVAGSPPPAAKPGRLLRCPGCGKKLRFNHPPGAHRLRCGACGAGLLLTVPGDPAAEWSLAVRGQKD